MPRYVVVLGYAALVLFIIVAAYFIDIQPWNW